MRTTVDLPDPLLRALKAAAAQRGMSLKDLMRIAIEAEIRKTEIKTVRRVKFPVLPSSEPGTLHLTNADIEDLLA